MLHAAVRVILLNYELLDPMIKVHNEAVFLLSSNSITLVANLNLAKCYDPFICHLF
jgi:hypothetical protein